MMEFDPQRHHRRSIRLKGYDYSQPGAYFVTVVTFGREMILGEIVGAVVEPPQLEPPELWLSEAGQALWEIWLSLPERYPMIALDEAVVMPNHFHGIIWINDNVVGAVHEPPLHEPPLHEPPLLQPNDPLNRRRMVLPMVIGYLKMNSAKRINQILSSSGVPVWQRDYYEHIIRDDRALNAIRTYIRNNPLQWATDEENPKN